MPASTNKSILITPGSYSSLATSVSQIDLKWYESGIGTFVFVPNSGDLRSTIYNWQQNSEPVILFGGIGTYNNQRKFVGPYQDFSGSFTGITSFPYIQFYPLSGTINANTINVTGVASFTQIYVNGLSTIGSLYLPGPFYDNSFSPGTLGQLLQSTGSGIAWTSVNTTGIITASGGISNRVTKFLDEDTIGNSTITDTGTAVSIGVGLTVNGAVTSFGFYGPGTFITNLNASNLASGTVPSGRVTGSYSGITSVGNLDLLYVIGVATASAFFGNGANLSNLNASNLTSGTVSSARVTGDYSGITSVGALSQLIVSGFSTVNTIRISGSLYDSTFSPGLNNQFLISTGTGIAWTTVSATGILTGSGTLNTVAKFGSPNSLVDSKITDTGSVVTIGVGISVSGFSSSFGFYGPGTFITNLNASNLASGTVPSGRVTGNYSGITSVGTLTQLITIGFATASGFFGPGTFITNLNASNLASGTVPSAAVTGSYSGITSVGTLTQLITSGFATASGFFGPGTFITNLSASNLASGTVPSDRVVGSYSGITSVGTLTQLITIGFATASGFFGPGTFITNLNASNLVSGTVPSAVVTGSYSGITSVGSLSQLVVTGFSTINSIKINGSLYDASFNPGSTGQYLISTGSGIAWTTISATGILTGSGTQNTIAKFGSSNSLTNSNITDTGSVVSIGVGLSVFGFSSSAGFYGPGTFITNLNASSLASGTVPSDRVVGSYSGITSVGTLNQLNVNGLATATAFLGDGANLTNLNASNLALGTVPSARIAGAYSGITSVGNLTQLNVIGLTSVSGLDLNGAVYDNTNSAGAAGQVLSSTGSGVAWSSANSLGIITGRIQQNQVAVGGPGSSIVGFSTFILTNTGLAINTTLVESTLTVSGSIKATNTITGSQLISTVFAPVPPLIVNSTTQVTNLNAEYWGNQYYPLTTTGDLLYSSDNSGTAARLAPNTSTIIKVLTQVGNGTEASAPSWQVLPTAGFIQYFFTGLAASNAPNNFQLANDLPIGLGTTTASVATGEVLVAKYITDPGVPGLEFLPAGNLSAYVWGSQTFGTSSIQLRVDFYETTAFGTSINKIVSTNDSTSLSSSPERFTLIGITTTTYNLASRDSRIQAQVYAVHGGVGIATVNVLYGNGYDSLVQVVAPGADVTNFVPYQGAVYDVNLGTKNLQAGSIGLYTGFSTVSASQGQFVWNPATQEVDLGLGDGYSVSVGFENALRVYNNTLNPLGVGSVVYVTGSAGDVPTVSLAQANAFQSGAILGVLNKQISASSYGYVYTYGTVPYDTSSFNTGDKLFLSATQSGILTNISPIAPNFSILVGAALNSVASGSIVVSQNSINTLNEPNRILFANSSKFPQGVSTFVYSNGNVGIGTSSPTQSLHVQGNFRLSGGLYDSNNGPGTLNQILSSTGAGIAWTSINTTGIITASGGTPNRVTKFLDEDTIGNSTITDTGLVVTVGVGMSVLGFTSSAGFYGPGTFITNLNASNLASGTVPSAVVTGSYSGITSVGTLTQLITSGFATASGFFGPGTFITNLNASNLASGTAPSAVISGTYSGITSVGTLTQLIVSGFSTINNIRISGALYDSSFRPGSVNQVLISTGAGISWTTATSTGILTGSGTINTVPKFNTANSLTNSNITDSGTQIVLGSASSISGILTSFGYFGPGTNITNLNASNLASGTVPSAVVSGSYSGITSVGTLTQLITSGFATATGFFGPGTFITNLNASNLASGTVPSAVVSGTYSGITSVGTLTQLITSGFATATGFFGPGTFITNLNASNLASGTVPSAVVSGSYSGITSIGTLSQLIVSGFSTINNIRISGALYDGSFSPGTANQVLISTGTGIAWTTSTSTGILTGSGTINTVPKFNTANSLTNSNITDNGIAVTVGSRIFVNGIGSFTGDITVNTITIGLGSGQIATNTALGFQALLGLTTGVQVTAVGYGAGQANTIGQENTFIGYLAGRTNTLGSYNIALGGVALFANTSGGFNVAVGVGALTANTIGSTNAALGHGALAANTSGSNNAAFGFLALQNNVTTSGNTALGREALRYYANSANQTAVGFGALQGNSTVALNTGTQNTAVGYQAGLANTSGSNNVFIGFQAGLANTSGNNNTFVGNISGSKNTTGIDNTGLGAGSLRDNTSGQDNTAIGNATLVANTTGSYNNAVGVFALVSNTTGSTNQAFGYLALQNNTSGGGNLAFGHASLQNNTTANTNIAFGNQTLTRVTTNGNNTAVGSEALRYATVANQVAVGYQALTGSATTQLNSGTQNTALGYQAGTANTSGSDNLFVGFQAGAANTTGSSNAFLGGSSGASNTSGDRNASLGHQALQSNTINGQNVAVGQAALRYFDQPNQTAVGWQALQGSSTVALNTGVQNVALGYQAGLANTSGSNNSYLGFRAGTANTSGNSNIFVGTNAGASIVSGSNNIIIGTFADGAIGSQYQIAIGISVTPTGSNMGAWGRNSDSLRTDLGIGTYTPLSRLHVETLAAGNMGLYIAGAASQTADLVEVNATTVGQNYFTITGIGSVGIYTNRPSQALDINGGTRLRGRLFDNSNSAGSVNQVLISTGSGIAWTTATATGIVTGTGAATRIAYFADATTLTSNSNFIIDSVGNFGISTNIPRQRLDVFATARFSGPALFFGSTSNDAVSLSQQFDTTYQGTNNVLRFRQGGSTAGAVAFSFFDDLPAIFMVYNAANSPRVGIGTTGPLQTLHVGGNALISGFTTSAGFFGPGTNLTNLNASNLASGTVPSAVVSGSYSGITSVGTQSQLIVSGFSTLNNVRITGALYDGSFSPGTINQILISTGAGISWTSATATGIVTGSGSASQVTYWAGTSRVTGNNLFVYNGIGSVGIGTNIPEYALHVVGTMAATIKSFIIDHPTQSGRKLRYASLEGPENGVYVRGRSSDPIIILPNYWTGLVDEDTITVNITPVGKYQNIYVEKIVDYVVYVKCNSMLCTHLDYFYTVYGERKDVSKLEVEI